MDLKTGRVITRRRVTEVPVTELVIQAVENMAHEQRLTTLKITGRHTSPLYPADWIAGVNYDQNQYQDEDYIDDEEEMIEAEIENEELHDRIDPEEIAELTNVRDEGEEETKKSTTKSPIQSCKKKMEYQKSYKNMKKSQNKKILKFRNKKNPVKSPKKKSRHQDRGE
jgi:hypothetical protein